MDLDLDKIQFAAQTQFSRQSEHYGKNHILQNVDDVAEALQSIPFRPGAKALDVATGAGHTGLFLALLGYDATLADIAQPMLDKAAKAAAERNVSVKTMLHEAEKFPYAGGTFDLVTCRVAAHHFSSPEKFISETARVLKDGGHFLLIDGSVADDQPEAEEWLHAVEKLRDFSHHRFLTPRTWAALCQSSGLEVRASKLFPFKQPDLNWYFETAATPDENRIKVLELVARAPDSVRSLFRLEEEDGKIVWWWQRLTLIAAKTPAAPSPATSL
ncbi:MAG TPA: class I SAM-dependent methyltransferase [Verrucomicrobiae bacterium]|jgi:ubiquinone/menaquinone biosynthesis C-methylase UbiE|nr:class I SAM-dependent methyltransferase [Verrucomicrobiae bacterium]